MSSVPVHPVEPAEGEPSVPPPDLPAGGAGAKPGPDRAPSSPEGSAVRDLPGDGRSSAVDWGLGAVRTGVGVALVLAPGWAGRVWVGPGADGPGSKVFARALGARDVALGVQIMLGVSRGEPVRHWVLAGFVADAADVTASVIASRNMTPARRVLVPLVAGAVGALGISSWKAGSPEAD